MQQTRSKRGRINFWWSRERVLDGLRRFYADFGVAPISSEAYSERQQFTGEVINGYVSTRGWNQKYPSRVTVLRHFRSLHDAWAAIGIRTHRGWQEWTTDEDRYILETVGLVPREEVARHLNRSVSAVKRRIYDLGGGKHGQGQFVASRRWGWSMSRTRKALHIAYADLTRYIREYRIPQLRGNKSFYIQPVDLLAIREIKWDRVDPELDAAIRQALVQRLCAALKLRKD